MEYLTFSKKGFIVREEWVGINVYFIEHPKIEGQGWISFNYIIMGRFIFPVTRQYLIVSRKLSFRQWRKLWELFDQIFVGAFKLRWWMVFYVRTRCSSVLKKMKQMELLFGIIFHSMSTTASRFPEIVSVIASRSSLSGAFIYQTLKADLHYKNLNFLLCRIKHWSEVKFHRNKIFMLTSK